MKVQYTGNFKCPKCYTSMMWSVSDRTFNFPESIECTWPGCEQFGIKYKVPEIELELFLTKPEGK